MKLDGGRIPIIKENKYVLTLDYTIKMLNIHERFMCGSPVIIEGETGVGKTALVEILSKLWNQSLLLEWKCEQLRLRDFIQEKLNNSDDVSYQHFLSYTDLHMWQKHSDAVGSW